MEEARYVKVASRFFLAGGKGNAGGDGCGDRRHFLDACFLCKRDITSDRHIFMYKYVSSGKLASYSYFLIKRSICMHGALVVVSAPARTATGSCMPALVD